MSKLRNSLALDHAREMDLDDPARTRVHGEVIKQKLFLRNFYRQVYKFFVKASEDVPEGPRLELGSGGGFIKEFIPDVVTSDLMPLDEVDAQISATDLPYEDGTLSVIYMLDVFHHIQNVEQFLDEAMRALKPGGRIVMVETGGSPFAGWIYRNFHHEPFDRTQEQWQLPEGGPLSTANQALPWLVFVRDRKKFIEKYPGFDLSPIRHFAPMLYLLSGGVSFRQLLPSFTYPLVAITEVLLKPLNPLLGMFMKVVLEKKPTNGALENRHQNEIEHGKFLAEQGAEDIWGWGSPAGQHRAARRGAVIREGAECGKGDRVLEIGCGTGLFTEMVAQSNAHVLAVDISEELLIIARKRGLAPEQVDFVCKGFEQCDVDGPFDAVVGSSILHHLEFDMTFPKIFELLKPGGVMSFAEPNLLNPQILVIKKVKWIGRMLGESPDETAFVRWKLKRQLEEIGFTDVEITPFDWLHPVVPKFLITPVKALGKIVEMIPGVREFSGSLHIKAKRPQ